MPFRSMEQGIAAIQSGNIAEGARLLKIALKNPDLQGTLRATALLWLAETKADSKEKSECYREALAADPNNQSARERLAQLLAASLPPVPGTSPMSATHAAVPAAPPQGFMSHTAVSPSLTGGAAPRSIGIQGGPNGSGTGFFITREGLVATTRFVVGGAERVVLETEPGRQFEGIVARSWPDADIAIIHTGVTVGQLLPVTSAPVLPDNTPITAAIYGGRTLSGQRRPSQASVRGEWFPTTIGLPPDAGGSPLFDDRGYLVGILTRNTSRTSNYAFGIHISAVYRCLEHYTQEIRDGMARAYCPGCGFAPRAGSLNGFYCENCGSVLSAMRGATRYPLNNPQLEGLYGETIHRPCPYCSARVGYYHGLCLRCGNDITRKQ